MPHTTRSSEGDTAEIDWHGTGWRCWQVGQRRFGGLPMLRNPWANSGLTFWWEPGAVQVAECFWDNGVPVFGMKAQCQGTVAPTCTCGVRSMTTLENLAAFMASDRQLDRHPEKAAAIGRVRIGGRIQHHNPGLPRPEGYNRSEYAELIGPVFVSPLADRWTGGLSAQYGPDVLVVPPESTPAGVARGQQAWLEALAEWVEQNTNERTTQ
jgi:hypothetical protein